MVFYANLEAHNSNSQTIEQIGNIDKITDYQDYYKVRFGRYQVGIKREGNFIIVSTVKHRSEIYKFFP